MVPVRCWVVVFGAAENMIRVCVPEAPVLLVSVIQSLLLVAVRTQPAGDAVMVKVRPVPPLAETLDEAGDRLTEVQF